MISNEECRDLIPDNEQYTDEQIEEINNNLHELADILLSAYFEKKRKGDLMPSVGGGETS